MIGLTHFFTLVGVVTVIPEGTDFGRVEQRHKGLDLEIVDHLVGLGYRILGNKAVVVGPQVFVDKFEFVQLGYLVVIDAGIMIILIEKLFDLPFEEFVVQADLGGTVAAVLIIKRDKGTGNIPRLVHRIDKHLEILVPDVVSQE